MSPFALTSLSPLFISTCYPSSPPPESWIPLSLRCTGLQSGEPSQATVKEPGQPGDVPRQTSWLSAQLGSVGSKHVLAEWPPISVAETLTQGSLQEEEIPRLS